MSDAPPPIRVVDLAAWAAKARIDPVAYRTRQLVEVVLTAVSLVPELRGTLYLKGGILMALAYDSPRSTTDIDFTAMGETARARERLEPALNAGLRRATARLGYLDLLCRVQSVTLRPRADTFETARNPAVQVTIAAADKGTADARRLEVGQASRVLRLDITFREPVEHVQEIGIGSAARTVQAYSLADLLAEKLWALLQQPVRNRSRRQDVFDVVLLIEQFDFDAEERAEILRTLRAKANARDLPIDRTSMGDPEIARRARGDWPTLQDELPDKLPDFDAWFAKVRAFYEGLPW